jgi:hypothetical protein
VRRPVSNLVFFVSPQMVVAVDAGTTEESAREAVAALRQITRAAPADGTVCKVVAAVNGQGTISKVTIFRERGLRA